MNPDFGLGLFVATYRYLRLQSVLLVARKWNNLFAQFVNKYANYSSRCDLHINRSSLNVLLILYISKR